MRRLAFALANRDRTRMPLSRAHPPVPALCLRATIFALLLSAFPALAATEAANPATGSLHLSVIDEQTGKTVAARAHLKNASGKAIKAPGMPWHKGHFTLPGPISLELPVGEYRYEIEHGQQWSMAKGTIFVRPDSITEHVARLRELIDISAEGWWSGDLHVHRPIEDMRLLMEAEDVQVAPSITWWNRSDIWRDGRPLPQDPLIRFPGDRCNQVMAGEDEREGGALLYFNLQRPLAIAAPNREFPSPMKFLAEARRSPDVHVDIEKPFWWDVPLWLASGKADTIGIANNHMCRDWVYDNSKTGGEAWGRPRDTTRLPSPHGNGLWSQEIYYHALNAGLRIPPSAGSASGVLPNPLGYNRVWVHVGPVFDRDLWWKNLRAGHSFVSNGPLLRCRANDQLPGHVFKTTANRALKVELAGDLFTRDPISRIEIVKNGAVITTVPFEDWHRTGSLGSVTFAEPGWFLVRAIADNPDTFRFASTAPWHVEFEGKPRRVSRRSSQFFLDWVRERTARVKLPAPEQREAVLRHHRNAEAFWLDRVKSATAD